MKTLTSEQELRDIDDSLWGRLIDSLVEEAPIKSSTLRPRPPRTNKITQEKYARNHQVQALHFNHLRVRHTSRFEDNQSGTPESSSKDWLDSGSLEPEDASVMSEFRMKVFNRRSI